MFFLFSNKLGCLSSIAISVVISILLFFVFNLI